MPKEQPAERRKTLRMPIAARVTFSEGNREEVWFTENMSEGGLYLKTEKPPFVGTVLNLEISLPGVEKLVKLSGEVMWRYEGHACGVRFRRVTAQIRKTLTEFLESAGVSDD